MNNKFPRIGSIVRTIAIITTLSLTFMFTACAENADIIESTDTPDYSTIVQMIDDYNSSYAAYLEDENNPLETNFADGYTPFENPCYTKFVQSPDGAFKSLTLEISVEDTITVQEYYAIDDNTTFIAVSTVNNTTGIFDVQKYAVCGSDLYQIDEDAQELVKVEHPDSLDIYLSFAEITELYGIK